MTKRNERTSARVARIAGRVLSGTRDDCNCWMGKSASGKAVWVKYSDIRALAASCLTQAEDRPKRAARFAGVTYDPAGWRVLKTAPRRRARRK